MAPFLTLKESSESELAKDQYEGYLMDLADVVAEVAGLNHTLHINTSSYATLVQDLVDNKTDIIIADLTISEERTEIIDFSIPFMTAGLTILMKKPSITDPAPFSFMKPFSLSIWLYILAAYVAVSCTLAAITRLGTFCKWSERTECATWVGLHTWASNIAATIYTIIFSFLLIHIF